MILTAFFIAQLWAQTTPDPAETQRLEALLNGTTGTAASARPKQNLFNASAPAIGGLIQGLSKPGTFNISTGVNTRVQPGGIDNQTPLRLGNQTTDCDSASPIQKMVRTGKEIENHAFDYFQTTTDVKKQAACAIAEAKRLSTHKLLRVNPVTGNKTRDSNTYLDVGAKTEGGHCFMHVKIASSMCNYLGDDQGFSEAKNAPALLTKCGFAPFTKDINSLPKAELDGVIAVHPNVYFDGKKSGHIEILFKDSDSGPIMGVSDYVGTFQKTSGVTFWKKYNGAKSAKDCGGVAKKMQ